MNIKIKDAATETKVKHITILFIIFIELQFKQKTPTDGGLVERKHPVEDKNTN